MIRCNLYTSFLGLCYSTLVFIQFCSSNHANALDENTVEEGHLSGSQRARPDQFCIHRVYNVRALLMTVKYKPPYKLTVENLRVGLRPMNFWEELV